MPKTTNHGAFGRPRIKSPGHMPGGRHRRPPPPGPTRRQRLVEALKPRTVRILLALTGAAAGLAVAITLFSSAGSLMDRNPAGRSVPPDLPDYAATIRAPTPTPGASAVPTSDVYVDPADVIEFRAHSLARAIMEATAIAASTNHSVLLRVMAEPPAVAQCFRTLHETLAELPLLPSTPPHAEAAASCLIQAINLPETASGEHPYVSATVTERIQPATIFLSRYAASADPVTRATAHLPSPDNMTRWRATRDARQDCYLGVDAAAARVAGISDLEPAAQRLEAEAADLVSCLQATLDRPDDR